MRVCIVLMAVVGLAACSATGSGTGIVTSAKGRPAGQARVKYLTEGGATAQLQVIMPDSEVFLGPAISGSRRSEPVFAFGLGVRPTSFVTAPATQWTGEITAALHSPAGRTMDCTLREKRVGLGLEGGAIGTCFISDGRRVQIEL